MGRTHKRSPRGVTTRLVGVVMLPVTVMAILAASVVMSRHTAAAQAQSVERGVTDLSELVSLRSALQNIDTAEEINARFAQLGVSRDEASGFLGFDIGEPLDQDLATASRAVAALGTRTPISAQDLESMRADISRGSPSTSSARLATFFERTRAAVMRSIDELEVNARDTPLLSALDSVRAVSDVVEATAPQVIDLSAVWFPAVGELPQATGAAVARLRAATENYAAAGARIHQLGVAAVVAGFDHVDRDVDVRPFTTAIDGALTGVPVTDAGGTLDAIKVAVTFRAYFARETRIDALVVAATAAVLDRAHDLNRTQRTAFISWTLATLVVALASVLFAIRMARTVARPLKDLARYADAVSQGDLDAEPAASLLHGPRETRAAYDVFTHLVANLQLLDAKANALAQCDFDDPVLHETLPGRLGASLESSVALLSSSIVERDQLQTHLAHQATHDSLTGVGNRPAAITAIEAAMQRGVRTGATTALLFADLNEFKAVNDVHGHDVGDEVLRQVAHRIVGELRSGDFVARLGGDEFVIVAEGLGNEAGASELAQRVVKAISQPIAVGNIEINIGTALGVALTLDGPEEPLRLLARADAAMYRAKHHDRSAIEMFDADLQQQLVERLEVETALTVALADGAVPEFELHYQPVVDAMSERLVGVEGLIRWNRPGQGLLAPDSFIPIAEASALIIDIDRWVLGEAVRQLGEWSTVSELADVPMSVNISGRHLLSHQLSNNVRTVLEASGVDPRRLSIEITETVLLNDLIDAAIELDAVRALGVRVALDDFGTGFTSLAHLQRLPIDTIKIDRSFVSQLDHAQGNSLVRMVTDLGHAIDVNVIAEGVETPEEMHALQDIGTDQLQGFLLSRPLPPDALAVWARRHAPTLDLATSGRFSTTTS